MNLPQAILAYVKDHPGAEYKQITGAVARHISAARLARCKDRCLRSSNTWAVSTRRLQRKLVLDVLNRLTREGRIKATKVTTYSLFT